MSDSRVDERPVPPQRGERVEPDSPLDLGKRDWRETLKRTLKEMRADRVTLVAGGLATFWFLAVFPALIAAVGFLGLVGATKMQIDGISRSIESILPGNAATLLTTAVESANEQAQGASLATALIGLALALWSASAGMVALQTGLNVAYDVPEERKFLKARLISFALILATGVLGGIASALLVFGDPIGAAVSDALPLGDAFGVVWQIVRWVVTLLAITMLFAVFYFLAPNREAPRWQWVSAGGILGTVIWLLASLGFRFYVEGFGSYGETYGALAGVVVLLLWLFLTGLAVMIGGELNAELERQSQKRKDRRSGADADRSGSRADRRNRDGASISRRGDRVIGGLALLGGRALALKRRKSMKRP